MMRPSCQRSLAKAARSGWDSNHSRFDRVVDDLLDESLDRLSCLNAKLFGNPSLLEAGFIDDVG